jgi:Zn-dependent protease/predicted transcriptional regulator
MFGRKIPLFSLFGFKINVDLSWFILAVLITWSLAEGLFPYYFKGFSNSTYWWMGACGALGLFISIIFHEFFHSIVARGFGMPMKGITLFIFGGVSELGDEPSSAKSEFLVAIIGPLSSVALAGILFVIRKAITWPAPADAVVLYLAWLNLILAGFNMIPAFPLDGGRVLRSILWAVKKNLRWATRIASGLGEAFGILLIVFGIFTFIGGNFIGGIWYFLIGMFVKNASQSSYQQLLVRNSLSGEHVRNFMKTQPVTVPSSSSVADLVENYFYKYHYKMFPVSSDGRVEGCVTPREIKSLPKEQWPVHKVSEIETACSDKNTITPDTDAIKALSLMNTTGNSRLMVVEGDKLIGIVTLKDMLKFLSLKIDLEGESGPDTTGLKS